MFDWWEKLKQYLAGDSPNTATTIKVSKVSGYVKFERVGKDKKQVSVYPERH